ncbi:sodium-translocating pyrophosphatase [Tepidiforma thermophila]|uniref:Putative K(+)-stimulated pyrophosphate-energized sodium pump n=1 Tax=Tepidiforma thermophila (strain KCTC 52669 / CGMCC 1.13589 / G233) TaxID=2761530 RepID=A0A2A9HDB6_TEPT2|nr:sodium-translocating pyrophosphatase [Tepidiforma thermophila]PFG73015.1 K(+)-stimulated pyrophosphate-energized sodium pump [Tepidiforma thermophila]
MNNLLVAAGAGVIALLFAAWTARRVLAEDEGTDTMKTIASAIQEGAAAFLRREYTFLSVFVVIVAIALAVFVDYDALDRFGEQRGEFTDLPRTAAAYILGAISSALAGYIGMYIAVRANVRTAAKARQGLNPALRVAFSSGAVMGITVTGISVIGLVIVYLVTQDTQPLTGYAFGASSIALFARVGGGIYTKAADVGADLVGKVEAGIPEDDPRNPATIADNVGDNVGDVAGMGADLFESYTGSIVAAMALTTAAVVGAEKGVFENTDVANWDSKAFALPLLIMGVGIISAIIGTFLVRTGENATMGRLLWALRTGVFSASGLVLAGTAALLVVMDLPFDLFWAVLIGLVAGQVIGTATEYYTAYEFRPTQNLSKTAETGPATVIIGGLGLGMLSTAVPLITIVVAIWATYQIAGLYGIALAAVGMLSPLGITLATDAYGPVADNAGGIAEQAHLDPAVRQRTDALDSLGNTTAATGKGFAIGSAVLTALALMVTYSQVVGLETIDILDVETMLGLLIGGLMPFVFAALAMGAVGRAAMAMVNEVRRQFREIPGIMEGTGKPDYARAVAISTDGAIREMVLPGLLAVVVPILVGSVIGAEALGGLLIGSIASGSVLALMMANAGGAWDNAKKYIEAGHLGGKGSEAHKAAVVGDTVGDPFKDTAGPSMNILLKLMSIVAVVFGPLFVG